MADEVILDKIHGLGDLDLAALLCLISREHCIISTEPASLDDLVAELQLVTSRTFGLDSSVVDCTAHTSLDDLAASIQVQQAPPPKSSNGGGGGGTPRSSSPVQHHPQHRHQRPRVGSATIDSYFSQQTPARPHRSSIGKNDAGATQSRSRSRGQRGSTRQRATPPPPTLSPLTPIRPLSPSPPGHGNNNNPPAPQIANVILAKNLDRAPRDVQIQCLELLRTRRIFTRTSVQPTPKQFLLVAVLGSRGGDASGRLTRHLNDHVFLSHRHDPEDGFPHLEEQEEKKEEAEDEDEGEDGRRKDIEGFDDVDKKPMEEERRASAYSNNTSSNSKGAAIYDPLLDTSSDSDSDSAASVVVTRRRGSRPRSSTNKNSATPSQTPRLGPLLPRDERRDSAPPPPLPPTRSPEPSGSGSRREAETPAPAPEPTFSPTDISTLAHLARTSVSLDVEVLRYQMNVVSFLRLHRAARPCVSAPPLAARHLSALVAGLAVIHGLGYATPALVAMAARKVFPHRLRALAPARAARERSVQWGSDVEAVGRLLRGVGSEDVVEDVLGMVGAPL